MNDTIFLVNAEGGLERIPHTRYESEDLLQRLIATHPDVLVGDQIDPDNPPRWLLIEREVGIPDREDGFDRWALDHLLLDQSGRPTFVEVKRSSDTRIRREVVGQMLDYAANALIYWPKDKIRALAAEASGGTDQLEIKLQEFLGADEDDGEQVDTEAYWDAVERHLHNGEVRLLFVADHIPGELRRIIEFLNEHMPLVEVLGVEVRQYEGKSVRALVPRVIGQTEFAKQQKPAAVRSYRKLTPDAFFARCTPKAAEFFTELLKQAQFEGYQLSWNPQSFSLRFPIAEGRLLTLFYGWPAPEDGSGLPKLQVYLGYLGDLKEASDLRKELLSITDFDERGEHTLEIQLDEEDTQEMFKMIKQILKLGKRHLLGAE